MELTLTRHESLVDGLILSFSGKIFASDLDVLPLNPFDIALMMEVSADRHATMADHLLVLEMLFRHHDELIDKWRQEG